MKKGDLVLIKLDNALGIIIKYNNKLWSSSYEILIIQNSAFYVKNTIETFLVNQIMPFPENQYKEVINYLGNYILEKIKIKKECIIKEL